MRKIKDLTQTSSDQQVLNAWKSYTHDKITTEEFFTQTLFFLSDDEEKIDYLVDYQPVADYVESHLRPGDRLFFLRVEKGGYNDLL